MAHQCVFEGNRKGLTMTEKVHWLATLLLNLVFGIAWIMGSAFVTYVMIEAHITKFHSAPAIERPIDHR